MSVVYDIKKWFLLIYLLTAGRSESEPCYINALCRGAITKAATTEIMVKIGVMQHKQLLVIKKVVALGPESTTGAIPKNHQIQQQ